MTLARCPFHKPESNLSEVVGEWYSNQRIAFWAVFCEACSAHGPEEKTKEEAIESWNYIVRIRNEAATAERERVARIIENMRDSGEPDKQKKRLMISVIEVLNAIGNNDAN